MKSDLLQAKSFPVNMMEINKYGENKSNVLKKDVPLKALRLLGIHKCYNKHMDWDQQTISIKG